MTVGDAAPLQAIGVHIVSLHRNHGALIQSAGHRTAGNIIVFQGQQLRCGNLIRCGSTHSGIHIRSLPVGIQDLLRIHGTQIRDPVAAFLCAVPAQEYITVPGGQGLDIGIQVAVIALNTNLSGALVVVEGNIGIIGRPGILITAVEVHIRLDQTAVHQGRIQLAAGIGPQGNGKNEIISGLVLDNRFAEGTVTVDPVGTAVICKQHHGIKLILGKDDIVAGSKPVDIHFHLGQIVTQEGIRLFLGNAIGIVILIAGAAVADGILAVVIRGILHEAFHFFQDLDAFLTGFHIGSRQRRQCESRDQTQHQNRCQQKTQESLVHGHTFSFTILVYLCTLYQ